MALSLMATGLPAGDGHRQPGLLGSGGRRSGHWRDQIEFARPVCVNVRACVVQIEHNFEVRLRLAEEVALSGIAAELHQPIAHLEALNTFRRRVQPERAAEVDDGFD